MVTNEKQRKTELTITRCFLKTDKSWIDYRTLTKTGTKNDFYGNYYSAYTFFKEPSREKSFINYKDDFCGNY